MIQWTIAPEPVPPSSREGRRRARARPRRPLPKAGRSGLGRHGDSRGHRAAPCGSACRCCSQRCCCLRQQPVAHRRCRRSRRDPCADRQPVAGVGRQPQRLGGRPALGARALKIDPRPQRSARCSRLVEQSRLPGESRGAEPAGDRAARIDAKDGEAAHPRFAVGAALELRSPDGRSYRVSGSRPRAPRRR